MGREGCKNGKIRTGNPPVGNATSSPPSPLSDKQLPSIFRERKAVLLPRRWLLAGELDEWGGLAIHLAVGGFPRLQPPHRFSLLHCRGAIFSVLIFTPCNPFICTPKRKRDSGGPSPTSSTGGPRAARGGGRACSRQTPPLMPWREGGARDSAPPATALCSAHPAIRRSPTSPRAFQPSREFAKVTEGMGGGKPRLRKAPPRRPSPHRAAGTTRRARQGGGRAGASGAHRPTRLRAPRPGLAKGGCRGFCSRGAAPSPGRSWRKVRANAQGAQAPGKGEGEGARWLWVSDPSRLPNLTQKGDAAMCKVCLQKGVPTLLGVALGGHREQPGSGRDRAAGLRRGTRAEKAKGSGGGRRLPEPSGLRFPRPRENGKGSDDDPGTLRFRFHPMCAPSAWLSPSRVPGSRDRVRV